MLPAQAVGFEGVARSSRGISSPPGQSLRPGSGCREVSPEVGVGGEPGLLQCREPGQQAIEHAEHHGAMEPCGHSRSALTSRPVEALRRVEQDPYTYACGSPTIKNRQKWTLG